MISITFLWSDVIFQMVAEISRYLVVPQVLMP